MRTLAMLASDGRLTDAASMAGRHWGLGGYLLVSALGCGPNAPGRSPECQATVNRCVEACGTQPEALSPREQSLPSPYGTNVKGNECEQRCLNRC